MLACQSGPIACMVCYLSKPCATCPACGRFELRQGELWGPRTLLAFASPTSPRRWQLTRGCLLARLVGLTWEVASCPVGQLLGPQAQQLLSPNSASACNFPKPGGACIPTLAVAFRILSRLGTVAEAWSREAASCRARQAMPSCGWEPARCLAMERMPQQFSPCAV